ncbi:MAG TPA: hypothetical protein VF282_09575 [Bacillota bacterium]
MDRRRMRDQISDIVRREVRDALQSMLPALIQDIPAATGGGAAQAVSPQDHAGRPQAPGPAAGVPAQPSQPQPLRAQPARTRRVRLGRSLRIPPPTPRQAAGSTAPLPARDGDGMQAGGARPPVADTQPPAPNGQAASVPQAQAAPVPPGQVVPAPMAQAAAPGALAGQAPGALAGQASGTQAAVPAAQGVAGAGQGGAAPDGQQLLKEMEANLLRLRRVILETQALADRMEDFLGGDARGRFIGPGRGGGRRKNPS